MIKKDRHWFLIMTYYQNIQNRTNFNVFKFDEFDQIPKERGIYSWHCYINQDPQLSEYNTLYRNSRIKLKAKGILQNKFGGIMETEELNLKDLGGSTHDPILLSYTTLFLSSPLYIGIACKGNETLHSRLNTHKKGINRILQNLRNSNGSTRITIIKSLRKKENSKLAIRISLLLSKFSAITENNLFIRVLPLEMYSDRQIKNIETYLNRTFHPILGRR